MLLTDPGYVTQLNVKALVARQATVQIDCALPKPGPVDPQSKIGIAIKNAVSDIYSLAVSGNVQTFTQYGAGSAVNLVNYYATDSTRFRYSPRRIIVTQEMQSWLESYALWLCYSDLALRASADGVGKRMCENRDYWMDEKDRSFAQMCDVGVPLCDMPLPQPNVNLPTGQPLPLLSEVTGGGYSPDPRTVFMRFCWTSAIQQIDGTFATSEPTQELSIPIGANNRAMVDISSIINSVQLPTGQSINEAGISTIQGTASGWTLYISDVASGSETSQGTFPLSTTTWTEPGTGPILIGDYPNSGQIAAYTIQTDIRFKRG